MIVILQEYAQQNIKEMSIKAHQQYQLELNRTLDLDKHLNELCFNSQSNDPLFQGKNTLYKQPYPRTIRIAPSVKEMSEIVKEISDELADLDMKYKDDAAELYGRKKELAIASIKPKQIITLNEPIKGGLWWGDTLKLINLRPGYLNNDPSKQYQSSLGGNEVHALAGGDTGEGKSVLMNAIILSLLYEYPPWELNIWLNDMKMLEFARYAGAYRCPQIRLVAATQSPEYVLSAMTSFDLEMNTLYGIGEKFGAQTLAGLRNYLNLAIPSNVMISDEFSQYYALGTPRQTVSGEKVIQSTAKLGRAVHYHFIKASQNFKNTIPGGIISQFSIGLAVGCDADTSEAITGTPDAVRLKKKLGYCIINNKKATKDSSYNREFKVAYWPDDKDEDRMAFQGFLKKVCDVGKELGCEFSTEYFNENFMKSIDKLDEDYEYCKRKHIESLNGKESSSILTMPLGLYMKYTGVTNDIGYIDWCANRRENIFINSREINKVKYICGLIGRCIDTYMPESSNTAVIDNVNLYEDYVSNFKKDLTGEFDVNMYLGACIKRQQVLKYSLMCKGNKIQMCVYEYLKFYYSKLDGGKYLNLVQSLISLKSTYPDSLSLLNYFLALSKKNIEECAEDSIEYKLIKSSLVGSMGKEINFYNETISRRKGEYLESVDFRPNIFWLFEPTLNEGIVKRGLIIDKLYDLLAIGPTVGIFFILVTTDARGMKQCMLNARHCFISEPQDVMEMYGAGVFQDQSGIGFKYTFIEGSDDDSFYFKQYFSR